MYLSQKPRSLASFAENFQFLSGLSSRSRKLVLRNVEEELAHDRAVAREVTFEAANVLKALVPDAFRDALLGQFPPGEELCAPPSRIKRSGEA